MTIVVTATGVAEFHRRLANRPDWPDQAPGIPGSIWHWIADNHRCNSSLWREEDVACRQGLTDAAVAACKRAIDRFNQQRHESIEQIDQMLMAEHAPLRRNAWLNSETAGSIMDRMSTVSLRIQHMRIQSRREHASTEHRQRCRIRLDGLIEQHIDLQFCLDALLAGMREGRCYFKLYRRYEPHGDAGWNPSLQVRQLETA